MQIKGVDVSKFQGAIDWKKVKEDGIQFALIRAGYGKETSQKDELFEQNYESCAANDIPCGCYWYSYALSPQEAVEEAQACLDVIRGKKFEYPVYLDIESDAQINLGKNIIEVANKEVKTEILSLAPNCANNIVISGENEFINESTNIIEIDKTTKKNVQIDDEIRFEQIENLYKTNHKEGKKAISKLLSKEKENFILYLLSHNK